MTNGELVLTVLIVGFLSAVTIDGVSGCLRDEPASNLRTGDRGETNTRGFCGW